MKTLKIIGIVLVVVVALFFAVGYFLPSEVHVQRSKEFDVPPQVIFKEVNSLKNWEDWAAWHQMATDMSISYSGPDSGVGAQSSWTSESMGNGSQKIIESHPYELIKTELDFQEQGTATGTWQFIRTDSGTNVIWSMDTDMGSSIVGRYFGLMMDAMVGPNFETGLNNLAEELKKAPSDTTSSTQPSKKAMEGSKKPNQDI